VLDDIQDLLKNVALISSKSSTARFSDFTLEFGSLSRRLEAITRQQSEANRTEASQFNLLDWLGIERLEDAHTRILKNLLDPRGTHGQGDLFLRRFLSQFSYLYGIDAEKVSSCADFLVRKEETSVFGRTDISLWSSRLSVAIIIENKIDAADQNEQLKRYRRRLDEGLRDWAIRRLFYLTPSGRKSSDPSAADVIYVPISYNEHIAGWLNSCIAEIRSSAVCEFVRSYAAIAANLREATNDRQI
jgi:hypothetical protein